jgi:hypothetical protein
VNAIAKGNVWVRLTANVEGKFWIGKAFGIMVRGRLEGAAAVAQL